jgi:hypothetical protein
MIAMLFVCRVSFFSVLTFNMKVIGKGRQTRY